jgi:hypothetical protein
VARRSCSATTALTWSRRPADEINEILETTKQWAIVLGGVVLTYKAIKIAAGAIGAMRAIGGAGGAAGAAAGMAIPVYIVDGPSSVFGNPAGNSPGTGGFASWLVRATQVGAVAYGSKQIYDDLSDFLSINSNRDAARKELQQGVNSAPAWLGGKAKLEIEVKGVAPKNLSVREVMTGSGLDVDVMAGVMGLR